MDPLDETEQQELESLVDDLWTTRNLIYTDAPYQILRLVLVPDAKGLRIERTLRERRLRQGILELLALRYDRWLLTNRRRPWVGDQRSARAQRPERSSPASK